MQLDRTKWRELSSAEVRDVQLSILRSFTAFCHEQRLTFYLCGGTLLGATRHNGYIPWDDDIDLMMPRADYETFIKRWGTTGPPPRFTVHSLSTDPHWTYPFAKLTDDRTLAPEDSDTASPVGVDIDIFPIDRWLPGGLASAQFAMVKGLRLLYGAKSVRISSTRSSWKNNVLRATKFASRPIRPRRIGALINEVGRIARSTRSTQSGVIVWGYHERVPSSVYEPHGSALFEGDAYPVPAQTDLVLTELYGDYMTLPPPEAQQSHHGFTAYGPISPADVPSDRGE